MGLRSGLCADHSPNFFKLSSNRCCRVVNTLFGQIKCIYTVASKAPFCSLTSNDSLSNNFIVIKELPQLLFTKSQKLNIQYVHHQDFVGMASSRPHDSSKQCQKCGISKMKYRYVVHITHMMIFCKRSSASEILSDSFVFSLCHSRCGDNAGRHR